MGKKIIMLVILLLNIKLTSSNIFLTLGIECLAQSKDYSAYGFSPLGDAYNNWVCDFCSFTSNIERCIIDHEPVCPNRYVCEHCGLTISKTDYIEHYRVCPAMITCSNCGETYYATQSHTCRPDFTPKDNNNKTVEETKYITKTESFEFYFITDDPKTIKAKDGSYYYTDKCGFCKDRYKDRFGVEHEIITIEYKSTSYKQVHYVKYRGLYRYCVVREGIVIIIERYQNGLSYHAIIEGNLFACDDNMNLISTATNNLEDIAKSISNEIIENKEQKIASFAYIQPYFFEEFIKQALGFSFSTILCKRYFDSSIHGQRPGITYNSYIDLIKYHREHWISLSDLPRRQQFDLAYEYSLQGYIVLALRHTEDGTDNISIVIPKRMGESAGWSENDENEMYSTVGVFDMRVDCEQAIKPLGDVYLFNRATKENNRKDVEFIVFKW